MRHFPHCKPALISKPFIQLHLSIISLICVILQNKEAPRSMCKLWKLTDQTNTMQTWNKSELSLLVKIWKTDNLPSSFELGRLSVFGAWCSTQLGIIKIRANTVEMQLFQHIKCCIQVQGFWKRQFSWTLHSWKLGFCAIHGLERALFTDR